MYFSVLSQYKKAISLSFIVLFSFGNLVWKSNLISGALTSLNKSIDYITFSFHVIGKKTNKIFTNYRSYQDLKKEVELFKENIKKNKSFNWKISELKSENERLRRVLNLRPKSEYGILQAEIISNKRDNWFHTVVIDKGKNENVKPYMPVIANQIVPVKSIRENKHYDKVVEGLVGKIIQVNPGYSRVLLITSQSSRLGVMLKKTGTWGLLEGQSSADQNLILKYINLNTKLNPGDKILTSGNEGVFPKGIPVGEIQGNIKRQSKFQESTVKPFLDFQKLDYVFIIQKESENLNRKIDHQETH